MSSRLYRKAVCGTAAKKSTYAVVPMNKKVAVVGAGPSGLAQLRAFQSAKARGVNILEVVCFEKQSNWGGL